MKTEKYDQSFKSIVFRCQQGSVPDFEFIVRKYHNAVCKFLLSSGIRQEDVDMVSDDTFLNAWQAIHRFKPDDRKTDRETEEHFKNWILQVAFWTKGDFFKKQKRQKNQFESNMVSIDDKKLDIAARSASPEDLLIKMEDRNQPEIKNTLINKYLNYLSEEDHTIICLHYMENRTYNEIRSILQTQDSETNLRKRAERALAKLNEHILTDAIDQYFLQKRKKKIDSISEFIIDYPLNGECGKQVEHELENEQHFIDFFYRYSPGLYRDFIRNEKLVSLLCRHYIDLETYSEMSGSLKSASRMKRRLRKITEQIEGIKRNGESHEND